VKEIALLTDELWFEDGMLDVTVTPNMVLPIWHPPPVNMDDVERREAAAAVGSSTGFFIGEQPEQGVPAAPEDMHQIGGGPLQQAFVAQYRRLFEQSGLNETPWAHTGLLRPEQMALVKREAQQVTSQERFDGEAPRLSDNNLLDGTLKGDLNLDLVTGTRTGMAVAIDGLHLPMLQYKAERETAEARRVPGADALTIWIPDFTNVPWREIIALHDHDAIGAFRAVLREAEDEARRAEPAERATVLAQIGLRESARELEHHFPTLRGSAFSVGLEFAIGFTPLAPLSAAVTAVREVAALQSAQSNWVGVYLALQRAARA
jgi:hypothetical protein